MHRRGQGVERNSRREYQGESWQACSLFAGPSGRKRVTSRSCARDSPRNIHHARGDRLGAHKRWLLPRTLRPGFEWISTPHHIAESTMASHKKTSAPGFLNIKALTALPRTLVQMLHRKREGPAIENAGPAKTVPGTPYGQS